MPERRSPQESLEHETALDPLPTPSIGRVTVDAAVVPGSLMLLASDLLIRDPSHQLAWRLLHTLDPMPLPDWMFGALRSRALFDRDPLALLLAGVAVALAGAYLGASLLGASARIRAWMIAFGIAATVLLPTFLFVAESEESGRPFGQDGGVVQLPLAMDRLLAGQSPYGADYSNSVLGKEAHSSSFWRAYGENPIVRHHAYLPGTHLLNLPFYLGARAVRGGFFDPRMVTSLAFLLAIALAVSLFEAPGERLTAAALIGLNPLVYWQQAFGANDILFVALLLASAWAGERRRPGWAGAWLGLASATKQLAWPFVPFLLVHWGSVRSLRELAARETWARLARPAGAAFAVFAAVVLPVALLDPRSFWSDAVSYNIGVGTDAYPLGGTPGFGIGNFVIYAGLVHSLRDAFPFQWFYLLLIPLAVALIGSQIRRSGGLGFALAAGSVSLLTAVYFSRVANANYLIAVATLLPVGVMLEGAKVDTALTPLALLGLSTTLSGSALLQGVWESARAADLPSRGPALVRALSPRAPSALTEDPLGLGAGALAAGLALIYGIAAILGATARIRAVIAMVAVVLVVVAPTVVVAWTGARTGVILAEDQWVVQADTGAANLARGRSPFPTAVSPARPAREAWSPSFHKNPPQPIEITTAQVRPGSALLTLVALLLGIPDGRAVVLFALLAGVWLCSTLMKESDLPLAWTALALLPPSALGIIFGAGQLPCLVTSLIALAAVRRGRTLLAGLFAGTALALGPFAIVAAVFASLFPGGTPTPRSFRRFVLGALASYAAIVGPMALVDPRAVLAAIDGGGEPPAAVVRVANIATYAGLEFQTWFHLWLGLGPWIAGALVAFLLVRTRAKPNLVAALWLVLTIFLSSDASAFALMPPIALLALGGTGFFRYAGRA